MFKGNNANSDENSVASSSSMFEQEEPDSEETLPEAADSSTHPEKVRRRKEVYVAFVTISVFLFSKMFFMIKYNYIMNKIQYRIIQILTKTYCCSGSDLTLNEGPGLILVCKR